MCTYSPRHEDHSGSVFCYPGVVDQKRARVVLMGLFLGPSAASQMWLSPAEKWRCRSLSLAASQVAPSLGCQIYNRRSLPTLGYVAQLIPPDKAMIKQEKSLNQKVYHIGNHVLPCPLLYRGRDVGIPQLTSLQALSFAARYRAARFTLQTVDENKARWQQACEEYGTLAMLVSPLAFPPHWDSPPLILRVLEAREGFETRFPGLRRAVDKVVLEGRIFRGSASPQSVAYHFILNAMFPYDPVEEIVRRILLWTAGGEEHRRPLLDTMPQVLSLLRTYPQTVCISVIVKVFCNGLPTTFRKHSAKRSCIWCHETGDTDRLLHLLQCPVFWATASSILPYSFSPSLWQNLFIRDYQANINQENNDERVPDLAARVEVLHVLVDTYQNMMSCPDLSICDSLRSSARRLKVLRLARNTRNRQPRSTHDRHSEQFHSVRVARQDYVNLAADAISGGVRLPNSFGGLP